MPEDDFTQYAARAWPGLVRTAALLTGDHAQAEDLAQATLLRVHRHWRTVSRTDHPDRYVHRILVNQQRTWWRRRQHDREQLTAAPPDRPAPAADTVDARDAALAAALAGLPARMRAVLVLRFYADLSEHQTAEALGCSAGTVKSQTSRGLARLRSALAAAPAPVPPPPVPARRLR